MSWMVFDDPVWPVWYLDPDLPGRIGTMRTVTIADCAFLPHARSESLGGENLGKGPTYFKWEQADPRSARFVTDAFLKDARGEGQVAWLSETFLLHPENYWMALSKPFDYVLTHNRYWADNFRHRHWLWQPHGGSWIRSERWGMHEKTKTKLVSMILSEKRSLPGHQLRHAVAEQAGSLIDAIYGYHDRRVEKFDGLSPYRYSVIIESERCPGFFSEKLVDCLSVGTIPIYWGCPDVSFYFDGDGIIQTGDLSEIIFALENIRSEKIIPDDFWSKAIQANIRIARLYTTSEDWIWTNYPFLFDENR